MSTYGDFDKHSKDYDKYRSDVWTPEVMVGAFVTRLQKPLNEIHVLDAGCGTGGPACMLLELGVHHITLLDANEAMLNKAKLKVEEVIRRSKVKDRRIEFLLHEFPSIPSSGESFDAVMFNMSLNHLVDLSITDDKIRFKSWQSALKEAKRVLKPGGVIFIQSFTKKQMGDMWFFRMNQRVKKIVDCLVPSNEANRAMLTAAGFEDIKEYHPVDGLSLWYDPKIFMDQSARDSDDAWELWTREEIELTIEKLHTLEDEGKLKEFCHEVFINKETIGVCLYIVATKK